MTGAFPWDEPAKDQQPANVTPIKGGEPTKEEFEQAVDDLFQEIYFGHFKGAKNEHGFIEGRNG